MGILSDKIQKILTRELNTLAQNVVSRARENASWSSRIPDAISLGSIQSEGEGIWSIDVIVDARKAPHALAFEFGSGIHDPVKPKTYIIKPKNVDALAIPLERWPDFEFPVFPGVKMIAMGEKGLLLRYVDHPGVAANPYLMPALDSVKGSVRGRFAKLLSRAYREMNVNIVEVI